MVMFLKSLSLFFLYTIFFQIPLLAFDDFTKPNEMFESYKNINTRSEVLNYFSGLIEGLTWSNTVSRSESNYETFCQPKDVIISSEDAYQIYKNYYLNNKSKFDSLSVRPPATIQPPALILVMGLQNKYPCY